MIKPKRKKRKISLTLSEKLTIFQVEKDSVIHFDDLITGLNAVNSHLGKHLKRSFDQVFDNHAVLERAIKKN